MAPDRTKDKPKAKAYARKATPKYVYLDKYDNNNLELAREMNKINKMATKNYTKIDLLESAITREVRINKAVFITILAVNAAILIYSLISS